MPPAPEHILVDHILIGVVDAKVLPTKRTIPEARAYAYALLEKLKAGADWTAAKKADSEDGDKGHPGGPYGLANTGVKPAAGEHPRAGMVPGFSDGAFALGVGDLGMV